MQYASPLDAIDDDDDDDEMMMMVMVMPNKQ